MAITRLGHFIAKFEGSGVPEGEFGSDVEGTKPILFNIDEDKRKMKEALEHCRKHLGDNVTILFDYGLPESIKDMVKEQGKCAGGPWDCYSVGAFYGWEAERVVAVTTGTGHPIMKKITRARTHLAVILVDPRNDYKKTRRAGCKQRTSQNCAPECKLICDWLLSISIRVVESDFRNFNKSRMPKSF